VCSCKRALGCFRSIEHIFQWTNHQFFCGLTTAQVVDPLTLYRDFPDHINHINQAIIIQKNI
jgi:hypothetical protein